MTEKERFDREAATWDQDTAHIDRAHAMAAHLQDLIRRYHLQTGLEVGAGTGYLSFLLRDELQAVTLMDTSSGMLQEARRKIGEYRLGDRFHTVEADLLTQPQPRRYDLIYILMTLHHIHDLQGILHAFYQHLNPGGVLAIGDLDEEDGSFHAGMDFDGHNGFDQAQLAKQLRETGFLDVHSEIFFHLSQETEDGEWDYPLFFMWGRK